MLKRQRPASNGMKSKENCIFCLISKGDIPKEFIYKNKDFLVFLDIKPVSFGHLLIIPKEHIVWMQDAEDKMIADIYKLAKKMMSVLKKSLKCDYVQLSVVGNEVPHFHVHLIPRYKNDDLPNFPFKEYKNHEAQKILEKILKVM